MTKIRVSLTILLAVFFIALSTYHVSAGELTKTVGDGGSIYGYVIMEDGSFIDGSVTVLDDDLWVDEYYLYDDDYFEFIDLPEGLYTLYFYDLSEIPVSEGIDVRVWAGQGTEVTLWVPYTFSRMSCDELMDWTYDEYLFAIDDAFVDAGLEYGWLSEMAMDQVASTYGTCFEELNDVWLDDMPYRDADLIEEVRYAVDGFVWAYYNVNFFQGTGAWHFGTRSIVDREYLVSNLIDLYYEPWQPDKSQRGYAMDVVDDLPYVADAYTGDWWTGQDQIDYEDAVDQFAATGEELADLMLELDADALVQVAQYVEFYLYVDI